MDEVMGPGGAEQSNSRASTTRWKGPGEGPRERLARMGPAALSDPELLAVLLGTGTRSHPVHVLAQNLLRMRGGLKDLVRLTPSELCALPGLGLARAARVLAALELGRRVQRSDDERPRLYTARDVYHHLRPTLAALRQEVFHVLCLNSRNVLLLDARVAEGTVSACPVDPREVFLAALTVRATAIILVHNHPSGDPEPSQDDVALTAQLVEGGHLLGIKVLDHVIVADSRYYSLMESRRMPGRGAAPPRKAWTAGH